MILTFWASKGLLSFYPENAKKAPKSGFRTIGRDLYTKKKTRAIWGRYGPNRGDDT